MAFYFQIVEIIEYQIATGKIKKGERFFPPSATRLIYGTSTCIRSATIPEVLEHWTRKAMIFL